MFDLPGPLSTLANFIVIAIGFGAIIFLHELGHFVAAKWAGIRVLAFSIGFGHVVCSYRKGIGFRKGSSDQEYEKLIRDAQGGRGDTRDDARAKLSGAVSPTEYRLSMLPLGGYVKMLGQEDLNPDAVSQAPDSYQNCPVGKRMVVISAGVIMNIVTAALLFIIVFMVGLKVFPPVVGFVPPDSPAMRATATNHPELGEGLHRGDRILSINGHTMHSYEAILPEIAMTKKKSPITIAVERSGVDGVINFTALPEKNPQTGLLGVGIVPAYSTSLLDPKDPKDRRLFTMSAHDYGLGDLEPGDVFVSANGHPINSPFDMLDQAEAAPDHPVELVIDRDGKPLDFSLPQVPALQVDPIMVDGQPTQIMHLLGLTGVLMVHPDASQADVDQGLEPGDLFARIGTIDYPTVSAGIGAIQDHAAQMLDVIVLRKADDGQLVRIKLAVHVGPDGRIGFYSASSTTHTNFVARPPRFVRQIEGDGQTTPDESNQDTPVETYQAPASTLIEYPGSRIVEVGGARITTLRDVQTALVAATNEGFNAGDESFSIPVTLVLPLPIQPDGSIPTSTTSWTLSRADIEQVRALGSTIAGSVGIVTMFEYAQIVDQADGPMAAIGRGVSESRRVMLQTYITFLRLFEGSVQVKNLKGPVGIAHLGTQIASQGLVWVLFFMALISINLAVVNFLPIPIVDGGQFLMLVYEWIRGKPVPIVAQNVATMAGLVMIGTIFLYVTFNDVKAIFGI